MIVYPAIDLKGGKCVRLKQGDMGRATIYGDDPAAVAASFRQKGARWLHVVDLDGAFAGETVNLGAVRAIAEAAGAPVQLGGGLRTMEHVARAFAAGVSRAILGTAALEDGAFLRRAVAEYGERIAVGIDARDGRVAVRGWAEATGVAPLELALAVRDAGVKTVIYTDISRDGMLSGPNFDATERLIRETGLDVIVSGGVAALGHVARAREIGAAGVIIGRALYTGAVTLEDAIAEGGKPC
jgi:phosphoribosylformimino-5-aminoimidazole carboxamide ribotide isomerase